MPAKDETLRIDGIDRWTDDARTRDALKRLAEAKAPQTVAQMVIWYVTDGADWEQVGRFSQGWGNAQEIALAQQFVASLDKTDQGPSKADRGTLYWDLKVEGDQSPGLADSLRTLWDKYPVLGLAAREGVPVQPKGPALSCQISINDDAIDVRPAASHPSGSDWVPLKEFRVKRLELTVDDQKAASLSDEQKRERLAARIGDAIAKGMVRQLVRTRLSRGPRVAGKESFRIKITNSSPMILNGLALGDDAVSADNPPTVLSGVCIPPLKSLTVPASGEMVGRLHLKDGVNVLAADLSGL
jgi:hypothetical protein